MPIGVREFLRAYSAMTWFLVLQMIEADTWLILRMTKQIIDCGEIEVHFARKLRLEFFAFRSTTTKQRSFK